MKIIFLDFDGPVSNYRGSLASGSFDHFDPVSIGILNNICAVSGAKIVCSSSRTYGPSRASYLENMTYLSNAGLDLRHIHPDWSCRVDATRTRAAHIQEWISHHPDVTHYAIIDDECVDMPHLIMVDENDGIATKDARAICAILEVDIGRVFRYAAQKHGTHGQLRLEFNSGDASMNAAISRECARPDNPAPR